MNHCKRHYEEAITDYCRTCHAPYCARCLVYSFGPKKPPYCIGCALQESGVRSTAGSEVFATPPVDRRAAKQARQEARAATATTPTARRGLFRRSRTATVAAVDPLACPPASLVHDARVPTASELAMTGQVPNAGQPL